MRYLDALGSWVCAQSMRIPWNKNVGLARTVLAAGTLLTLLFNQSSILFRPGSGLDEYPICQSTASINLFCIFSHDLYLAKAIAITILFTVLIGVYPRVTGVLHWWVSYSFANSAILLDGGDHITAILSALLVPICLTDNRWWHWQRHPPIEGNHFYQAQSLLAQSALLIISVQVAIIYFNAAVAKMSVPEWVDGTAIYYWWNHPIFGAADWLAPITGLITLTGAGVAAVTWGTIIFELTLFLALVMPEGYRRILLHMGILFHFIIILIHGLFSFFFAMSGALLLYLGPRGDSMGYAPDKTLKK